MARSPVMVGDPAFLETSLSATAQTWYARLFAAISNSAANHAYFLSAYGSYYLGRELNDYLTSLLFIFRYTGDLRLLDIVDGYLQIVRNSLLRTTWVVSGSPTVPGDGTAGLRRILWTANPASPFYNLDTHEMDEMLSHAFISCAMRAYYLNMGVDSPGGVDYEERYEFWRQYLVCDFEAKWRIRNAVPTGNPFISRGIVHPHLHFARYHLYFGNIDGIAAQITEAERRIASLRADSVASATGTAYKDGVLWPQVLPSEEVSAYWNITCPPTSYTGHTIIALLDLLFEGGIDPVVVQRYCTSVAIYVIDGDPLVTGIPYAAGLGGDAARDGLDSPLSVEYPRTTYWYWWYYPLSQCELFDLSGKVAIENDASYAANEADPNNPNRPLIPAARLLSLIGSGAVSYYVKEGVAPGGDGGLLAPWDTGASFIAGTFDGDLAGAFVNVAGDGTPGALVGQWDLGNRINLTLRQWPGENEGELDFVAAGTGTILKSAGWDGYLGVLDLVVSNTVTTAGRAAIRFDSINAAGADVQVRSTSDGSRFGFYSTGMSDGNLDVFVTATGGLYGLEVENVSGGSILLNGSFSGTTNTGAVVNAITGGAVVLSGTFSANQIGLTVAGVSGGSVEVRDVDVTGSTYQGILVQNVGVAGSVLIKNAYTHATGRYGLRCDSNAANGALSLETCLFITPGAGYACAYLTDAAVGVNFHRVTAAYGPNEGIRINNVASTGAQILGCILAFNGGAQLHVVNGAEAGMLVAYNCFWAANAGDTLAIYKGITYTRAQSANFFAALAADNPLSVGNVCADPLFVNAAAGDYRLSPGSPCLGAGVFISGVTLDLDRNPIPSGEVPDMGCYESKNVAQNGIIATTSSRTGVIFGKARRGDIRGHRRHR